MRRPFKAVLSLIALLGGVTGAQAQGGLSRAWVASTGADANPCTRAQPCRTFAGALVRVAAGGEINCVDSSEYGPFEASIPITVDCREAPGRIQAAAGPGIRLLTFGPNILRGLVISGAGAAGSEIHGIEGGGTLTLEEITVQNFNANASRGLRYAPGGVLAIRDSSFINNGFVNSGGGVLLDGTVPITATIDNVRVSGSSVGFVLAVGASQTSSSNVIVNNSQFSGNGIGLDMVAPVGESSPGGSLTITNSRMTGNTDIGLDVEGRRAFVSVSDSVIAGNGRGIRFGDFVGIVSFGGNLVAGNATDGSFNVFFPKT